MNDQLDSVRNAKETMSAALLALEDAASVLGASWADSVAYRPIAALRAALDASGDDEVDILAEYSRKDGRREWVSVGVWLRPGEVVAHMDATRLLQAGCAPLYDQAALDDAVAAERERCAELLQTCAESAWREGVADERERCCRVVAVQRADDEVARRTIAAIRDGDDFFGLGDEDGLLRA